MRLSQPDRLNAHGSRKNGQESNERASPKQNARVFSKSNTT